MRVIVFLILIAKFVYPACVEERILYGAQIKELENRFDVHVETGNAVFEKIDDSEIIPFKRYHAQLLPKGRHEKSALSDSFDRYNKRYLEYYTYPRLRSFLAAVKDGLEETGYEILKIGESLGKRDLFYVGPKELNPSKKTIVMFGRHHGDEGSANWIIEGFLKRYLSGPQFNQEYQLILYPMINPDGAMEQSRYNLKRRDLNRSWSPGSGLDEVASIHGHLKGKLENLKNVVIALDMHGSIREDFIYRVGRGFKGDSFYEMQQRFIDELGAYDSWQAGNFIHSNGHPGMARIVLINQYKLHALTHETIKNIPLRNRRGRTVESLKEQGRAILSAIKNLY